MPRLRRTHSATRRSADGRLGTRREDYRSCPLPTWDVVNTRQSPDWKSRCRHVLGKRLFSVEVDFIIPFLSTTGGRLFYQRVGYIGPPCRGGVVEGGRHPLASSGAKRECEDLSCGRPLGVQWPTRSTRSGWATSGSRPAKSPAEMQAGKEKKRKERGSLSVLRAFFFFFFLVHSTWPVASSQTGLDVEWPGNQANSHRELMSGHAVIKRGA